MKTQFLLFTFLCILLPLNTNAQENDSSEVKMNNLYFEFLGSAGMYSMQYERIIVTPVRWTQLAVGAGFSAYNNLTLDIPVHASLLLGPGNSRIELGAGLQPEMYVYSEGRSEVQFILFNRIGYRYQRRQGGFHFQCGITPLQCKKINWKSNWFGMGFGWTF